MYCNRETENDDAVMVSHDADTDVAVCPDCAGAVMTPRMIDDDGGKWAWVGNGMVLTMWYTGRSDNYGKDILGYQLTHKGAVIFTGEDFGCSPLYTATSASSASALLGFLTLRPGDVEADYFERHNYTPEQLAWTDTEAEALSMYGMDDFLDECWKDTHGV
jgi:hypothetical protein